MRWVPVLLAAVFAVGAASAAEPVRLDGAAGFLALPGAGIQEPRSATLGAGLQYSAGAEQFRLDPAYLGLSVGLIPGADVGLSLLLPYRDAEIARGLAVDFEARGRLRLAAQRFGRPAMTLELRGARFVQGPEAAARFLLGFRRKAVHVGIAAGGGVERGAGGAGGLILAGAGAELRLWKHGVLATDLAYDVRVAPGGPGGDAGRFSWKLGVKMVLGSRVSLVPWLGVEAGRGDLLGTFGASLAMSSADLKNRDGDRDGLDDSTDLCPVEAEDSDGFGDGDGCLDADNDGDGVLDAKDETPDGEPPPPELEGSRALFRVHEAAPAVGATRTIEQILEDQEKHFHPPPETDESESPNESEPHQ